MREDITKQMISIVDELYDAGLITPKGGNVSARIPDADELWITPTQLYKGGLTEETLIKVNLKGKKLEGLDRPSVELPMHLLVYGAREDVGAVIHTHAPMATIVGLFDEPIPAITIEAIALAQVPVGPFLLSGTREQSQSIVAALGGGAAVLLRNHGLMTVGKDLREAASRAQMLEFAARTVVLCRLLGGKPTVIPEKLAEFLKKVVG
ncbi:MAG TPA: class II aldolase/adducin family protein [Anaerolineae bacterium]|nr:class II aldolase/adducin family protein [Anaerolineae bacterium]